MTEHHSSLNRRTVQFNSREALAINYGAIELEWREHKAADISCLGLEAFYNVCFYFLLNDQSEKLQ